MKKCKCKNKECDWHLRITQNIDLDITQEQVVNQTNQNAQMIAIAVAVDGGLAKAVQSASQENQNKQEHKAIAKNLVETPSSRHSCCGEIEQEADVELKAAQEATQTNINYQDLALAVAQAGESVAIGTECSEQKNENTMTGKAVSINQLLDKKYEASEGPESEKTEQVNPAGNSDVDIKTLLTRNHSFDLTVLLNQGGQTIELSANDIGVIDMRQIQRALNENSNSVFISLGLDNESLEISADDQGNILVNGEKV